VQIYVGFVALLVNLIVAVVLTLVFRAASMPNGTDATAPDDYHADEDSPNLKPIAELTDTQVVTTRTT
jgi:SSS family solute:Na+ symporter